MTREVIGPQNTALKDYVDHSLSPEAEKSRHLRLAFLASGNGTSMYGVVEAIDRGELDGQAVLLISNNSKSPAMENAQRHDPPIPTLHLSAKTHPDERARDIAMRDALTAASPDVVISSGYMRIVGPETIKAFQNRILNIHPSIHPEYDGMMDMDIHRAVIRDGRKTSGFRIHTMEEEADKGITVTLGTLKVWDGMSPEELQNRIKLFERDGLTSLLKQLSKPEYEKVEYPHTKDGFMVLKRAIELPRVA